MERTVFGKASFGCVCWQPSNINSLENGYQTVGGNEKILEPPKEIQDCSHPPQMVVFGDEVH